VNPDRRLRLDLTVAPYGSLEVWRVLGPRFLRVFFVRFRQHRFILGTEGIALIEPGISESPEVVASGKVPVPYQTLENRPVYIEVLSTARPLRMRLDAILEVSFLIIQLKRTHMGRF
jgi:hypothetical protein